MKAFCLAFLGLCFAASSSAANLRTCTKEELPYGHESLTGDLVAANRRFDLPLLHYARGQHGKDNWGFDVELVIGADGVPLCYGLDRELARIDMPQRRAVIAALAGWRYTPFQHDGAPAQISIIEHISEDRPPATHVPLPDGPLDSVRLRRTSCLGTCPIYELTVSGDGNVTFNGEGFVLVTGPQHYKIPLEGVAAIRDAAARLDIWSMDGRYFGEVTDMPGYDFTLTIGGRSKTVYDYAGSYAGMPASIDQFQDLVDAKARTKAWITLSDETLALLKSENFDFTSQAAADLLAKAIQSPDGGNDDAILSLIELGAPLHGGKGISFYSGGDNRVLLNDALAGHRQKVVDALIQRGALESEDKPDQGKVDEAFQAAITGGRLAAVEQMWAYNPAITYQVKVRFPKNGAPASKAAPVTTLLSGWHYSDADWQGFAIARFLLDQGCDINGSNGEGETVLHTAARNGDAEFVRYLLGRGADPRAVDDLGDTPLDNASSEDAAIVLLDAGADPNRKPGYGNTFAENARLYDHKRVLAWLVAHSVMAPLGNPDGGYSN